MQIDTVTLKNTQGVTMPKIGIGTWHMGENSQSAKNEVGALRLARDLGFTHFDTAEMYGEGGAEEILGRAFAGQDRDGLFLTSKVYPWNAEKNDMVTACERSLKRLRTDHIDLYLLHWSWAVAFDDTLKGARLLLDQGKIRAFGISNFDTEGLRQIIDAGMGDLVSVNQVMHNIPHRGVGLDLFPLMAEHDITAVAYSPLEIGPTMKIPGFADIAWDENLTVAQLVLAWHMTRGLAVPIPKSSRIEHLDDLAAAAQVQLSRRR